MVGWERTAQVRGRLGGAFFRPSNLLVATLKTLDTSPLLSFQTYVCTHYSISTSTNRFYPSSQMESLLRQGKQVCPFLKRSSPAALKVLATSVKTTSRGYRVSALQTAATHCPVVGKALAFQQSKRNYVSKTAKAAMAPTH